MDETIEWLFECWSEERERVFAFIFEALETLDEENREIAEEYLADVL